MSEMLFPASLLASTGTEEAETKTDKAINIWNRRHKIQNTNLREKHEKET